MLESHSAIKNDLLLQNTVKWENFGWLSGYNNKKTDLSCQSHHYEDED
jgi:hypothetical protein